MKNMSILRRGLHHFRVYGTNYRSFPGSLDGKESTCSAGDPWIRKIPWRREWQPTPIFLPGEFHGQRSLVDYSPWGCKESDMTESLLHRFLVIFKMTGYGRMHSELPPLSIFVNEAGSGGNYKRIMFRHRVRWEKVMKRRIFLVRGCVNC